MGFNTPDATDSTDKLLTSIRNQIHVDGVNVKVLPAGTPPTVVYRIGDGTVHEEGWDNIDGEEYLDFYVSAGAKGAKGDKGEDGLSAYEQAVQGGYSGTQEEFYTLLTEVTDNAILAQDSAIAAALSESNASASEIAAQLAETNAQASATASQNSATASESSATDSANSATASSGFADASQASASAAQNSATNALGSANDAETSATNATTQAGIATLNATSASDSATSAYTSASEAAAYAGSVNPSNIIHTVGNGGGNPEGYTTTEIDSAIDSISSTPIPVSSQLKGSVALTNTVKQLGAGKFLYTGNGASQEIDIGLSSIDFTQSSNGTGYYHDRVAGDCIVKNDAGTIVESGSIAFKDVAGVDGIIKVHIKSRNHTTSHSVTDGVRGLTAIKTDTTAIENDFSTYITSFSSNGINIATNDIGINASGSTYVAYIELYTHIKWGLTSQGKRYIEAYNPVSNMGMMMYQGSGLAGHQIPHNLGVELDSWAYKRLDAVNAWGFESSVFVEGLGYDSTSALGYQPDNSETTNSAVLIKASTAGAINTANGSYILYYKAKSHIWTCGIYQGTGAAGNFVETRDSEGNAREPHEVIVKRIDSTSNWPLANNKAGVINSTYLNTSAAESAAGWFTKFGVGYFEPNATNVDINGSGGQYFYQAHLLPESYPNDLDGYTDNASNTTSVTLTDGVFSISSGYNSNGVDNEVVVNSGTISPVGGWQE